MAKNVNKPHDVCVSIEGYDKDGNFQSQSIRIGKYWENDGKGKMLGKIEFLTDVPTEQREIQVGETKKGKPIMSLREVPCDLIIFENTGDKS